MTEYANPDLLVETTWLAEHLNDPDVVIVEVAPDSSEFEVGHIPGARLGPTPQIKGSENKRLVAPPDEAKAWMESVGIGDDSLVVGYDRARNRDASRLWWVLNYYGHSNVKVLNGGWNRWSAGGHPVESGASAAVESATFTPLSNIRLAHAAPMTPHPTTAARWIEIGSMSSTYVNRGL